MSLNSRIVAALDAGVDAYAFERCGVALMMKKYDQVVAVEGGSDGGRDADIYGPIAGDPDSRGRILVTTGDSLDNLKRSHKTWKGFWESGEPFRVDQIVMVTSNPLSDTKRRNILRYCHEQELPQPTFYARQWLVEELRRDSELRIDLTGVEGRLEAVATRPSDASNRSTLIGRDDDLDHLLMALTVAKDVCLIGLPGVGKTRLLAELGKEAHFVEPVARERLTDDLITVEPSVVILDDAHLHLSLLEELVRIRSREQLGFRVLAASWPGSESSVDALLSDATRVVLDRLARPELDNVIQQLGVHGLRARARVLDQSDGRPGWAILLSQLIVDGGGERLSTGQPLLDQVSNLTLSISGTAAFADALACIAALGTASLSDLELIAELTGITYGDLIDWLESTAQGGLVERNGERWTVLRPLQTLIVASTFFGRRKKRRWVTLAERFKSDQRLDRAVLEVASDAPSPEVRQLADDWFNRTASEAVDVGGLALIELYGQLDEHAADRAAALARRVLAGPRESQALHGGLTYDPIATAAEGVLSAAFRQTCSREATQGLLDLAIDDDRPRHSHPDHPMRVIQDIAHYLDPDDGPVVVLRKHILTHALEWFDQEPSGVRWPVLAEVARYVFDPRVEGRWTGPGSHLTFTVARGLMSASAMTSLFELWQEIDKRVHSGAGAHITQVTVAHLCEVFRRCSSLAAGDAGSLEEVDEKHKAASLEGAKGVLATLAWLSDRFPAVPIVVNRHLSNFGSSVLAGLPIVDHRLAQFMGVREYDEDIEARQSRLREARSSLALEVTELGAKEGVAEYQRLLREASVLEGSYGALLAHDLAVRVSDADRWLRIAIEEQVPLLAGSMLAKARGKDLDVTDAVRAALEIPILRATVLQVILNEEDVTSRDHAASWSTS